MKAYIVALFILIVLLFTGTLFFAGSHPATARQSAPEHIVVPREVVEEVLMPVTLQQAYAEAVGRDDNSYHIVFDGDSYHAVNEEHKLEITFTETMIDISIDDGTWQLISESPADDISIGANKITYHRGSYDEWYINSPMGLQQGFTLYQPSDLTFEMRGTLATSASLHDLQIGRALAFTGLMAFDATQQTVPVQFEIINGDLQYVYDDAEASYPLTIDPWLQQARLTGSDATDGSKFGQYVAIDGLTAAVGATGVDCANSDQDCGAVYVFVRESDVWTEQAKLVPSDATEFTLFGFSVDLDGDNLIAGAANDGDGGAYVFTRTGTVWSEQQRLVPSESVLFADYGYAVAIEGDVAAASSMAANSACTGCGAVYVFTRSGSTWTEQDILTASDAKKNNFGWSIDLHNSEILVGAPIDNEAYLFDTDGITWTQRKKFTSSDSQFGTAVALDGGTAVIVANNAGKAYIYTGSGSTWTQETILTIPDSGVIHSASVSGDLVILGNVNALCSDLINFCGKAYIYSRNEGWTNPVSLALIDGENVDYFGRDVAIDGNLVIVGADGDDCEPSGGNCGAAYIFETAIPTDTPTPDPSLILTASAACVDADLAVTITQGEGPFNITASAGINTPVLGAGIGTTTITGPEKWDNLTVTETTGDAETINLGQFKCRNDERPTPLTPAHRAHITNPLPLFSWTAVSFGSNYRVFVFDDRVAANRMVDIRQNSGGPTQLTLAQPLPAQRLFWRVRGRTNRVWSLWSIRFTLFVEPSPVQAIPTIELEPTLESPMVTPPVLQPPNSR